MSQNANQPKRYWIDDHSAIEDTDGKWVLHSDYAALVQQGIRDHGDWRSKLNFLEADYKAEIARLTAENERLHKAGEWQSKDTIPKEGVDVLCWSGHFMFVGWVNQYGTWHSSDDSRFVPDCWMPLPQPPSKEGRDAK